MLLNTIIYLDFFCVFLYAEFFFVPMLCSLVLLVNVMHFFKYITFVPLLDSF